MRQPLRKKAPAGQQISVVQTYPPPVGGWNARDALADMKPIDAVALDNWFPKTTYCEIRGGWRDHADGMTGNVMTLAVYNALNGTNKFFAASNDDIWNVTTAGGGVSAGVTVTDGRWQWLNFGDGTNNYLIMVNGEDDAHYFNGAAWIAVNSGSSPALTGVASSSLIQVMIYQGRLFFIEKDSLNFWYLAAGAAGGALTKFNLSSIARMGGYLMAMATWTFDGGDGPDDYAVFVTSEGEIIVYRGTNPSDAAAWTKIGTYFIGKPIGRRCFVSYGGDVVLITQNGAFPLSAALQSSTIDRRIALTDKIEQAFSAASLNYRGIWGWDATLFPAQSALLFNIPTQENSQAEQYVMNTITKSWCRFTGWNANTFAVFNGELYFAAGAEVRKAWEGPADGDANIAAYGKTAFSQFGTGTQQKRFNLFRPVLAVNGSLTFLTGMDVDYNDVPIRGSATYSVTSGAVWDVSNWDEAYWAANLQVQKAWTSPQQNIGYAAAGKLKIDTNSLTIQWLASDYLFESGGIL